MRVREFKGHTQSNSDELMRDISTSWIHCKMARAMDRLIVLLPSADDDADESVEDGMTPYCYNKDKCQYSDELFEYHNSGRPKEAPTFDEINNRLATNIGATLKEGNGE